jgi:peptidoglycan/xylan/chitin deacetylase (PgdA/CDA1 family)
MFSLDSVADLRGRLRYCRTLLFGRRCIRMTNRTPVISFSFDDFPSSALHTGGGILEEHGVAGTYYTALGLMNTDAPVGRIFSERELHEVVARGHELGCHTFDHYDAWNTHPSKFEDSIRKNREALSRLLPGASFLTHSYPLSIPRPRTKQNMEKYFLGCRGCSQKVNSRAIDLNFLRAFFLEQSRGNATAVKAIIDDNSRSAGWLIFATHDVAENPSQFGCTPGFFRDIVRHAVASGAAILPVAAAVKRIHGATPAQRAAAA